MQHRLRIVTIATLIFLLASASWGPAVRGQDQPTSTPTDLSTLFPLDTAAPTEAATISPTAPDLVTNMPTLVPSDTATFTATASPTFARAFAVTTNTPRPTLTLVPSDTPTLVPTPTNTATATDTPTATLVPSPIAGRLCADCNRVRLRQTPGTAGAVLGNLDNTTNFMINGRTGDSAWIQITVTGNGQTGWVSAQFARTSTLQPIDPALLNTLPVTALAIEASPTATSEFGLPTWLSGVDTHTRQIFQQGQGLGNRANVFSKVGDSITSSGYFLTPIGTGHYDLGSYGELSGVIGYFSRADARNANSFANTSLAAHGGWNTTKLLTADPTNAALCGSDSPLVCEYKHVKPEVALIMIGSNDSGGMAPGVFGGNLAQIVQISINMGVIPVLSTIPAQHSTQDRTAIVATYNQVIRQTAQQFDVPLMDYWSAMQSLPNQGISSDGLHPSAPPDGATGRFSADSLQYGYTVRNLMALQALDTIWRLVLS